MKTKIESVEYYVEYYPEPAESSTYETIGSQYYSGEDTAGQKHKEQIMTGFLSDFHPFGRQVVRVSD
jgi:hypothetical protein